jgi:hypothetical protein
VVEGTGLENRHTGNGIVSSNLTLSARWGLARAGSHLSSPAVRTAPGVSGTGGRVVEGAPLETV